MAAVMTFPEWLAAYERTESATRVFAKCECGDAGCHGWCLAYRDDIYPHEIPLTASQREEWGVPDPFPDVPLRSVFAI